MDKQQGSIYGEVLLLCERLEQAQFLHVYLKYLFRRGLSLPPVQIIDCRGLTRLASLAQCLPEMPGSGQVRKAAFFADAAADLRSRKEVLAVVRSSTYFRRMECCPHFFFPGRGEGQCWQRGYLEDLLLACLRRETAAEGDYHSLYNIAEEYLACVASQRGMQSKLENHSRHLLYAYFAATEKYVGLRLAEAALQGAFALDSEKFASLRACLEGLA